jgi:trk system potassium uptake protein
VRVIIAGIGTMGEQLLDDLTRGSGYEVVAIEVDGEICERLADTYDALVIQGDAASPEVLDDAQVEGADAIIATTGSDPLNTIIAMLAHQQQVPRIVVKTDTNALRGALEEIGVTDIITPAIAAAGRAQAALHGSERANLTDLARGGLRLTELTVAKGHDGEAIADLDLPDGALAVAVLRDKTMTVAHRSFRLAQGDVLLVLADDDHVLDKVHAKLD